MSHTSSDQYVHSRVMATALCFIFLLVGGQLAIAGTCTSSGNKCGLPVVYIQPAGGNSTNAAADIFAKVHDASPSLYASSATYYVFYDSRSGKVSFQDENGVTAHLDANARNFVLVWHDGNSTDWRSVDPVLAARVPASAKGDEMARVTWAIKAATGTPRVIVVGSSANLAFAQYYVAGKAAPQFGGSAERYNNDLHGMFATDAKPSAAGTTLKAQGLDSVMTLSATDQYRSENSMVTASAVNLVAGITSNSTSVPRGQSAQFTSNIGPVVWSVLEGPSAGSIDKNGMFTAASSKGSAHVVAVSQANHSVLAVASVAFVPVSSGPTVTTGAVSSIRSDGGTFNGTVNPNGASGVAGFQYSTNSSFANADSTSTIAVSGSTATPITLAQARLTPNTAYYVRTFFRDGTTNVTTLGGGVTFKTTGSFITTTGASAVSSSDATLNASVNGGGVAGFVYFKYSYDNFVHTLQTPHISVPADTTTRVVSASVTVLKTSTAYSYQPVFDQSANGGFVRTGTVKSFSTFGIFAENDIPNWAVSVTAHGATFPGKYGTGGAAARVWIEISQSPTFAGGASVYGAFNVPAGTYAYQPVNITVSTLSMGTTYYVRYAIRNAENGFTYRYPYTRNFTTLGASAVPLSSAYNRMGFVTNGTTFAPTLTTAYDGGCCSMSANLLGSGVKVGGITYGYGAANTLNVIYGAGQTVNLPPGNWTSLKFLGSGVNGNPVVSFVVHYTDGSSTPFTQGMSDWYTPQGYPGETMAVTMPYRIQNDGTPDNRTFYLYAYSFALNSAKTLQSVTFPNNSNINVVAITLNH